MPLHRCDIADCLRPSAYKKGDCVLCQRHLCAKHLQRTWHKCPDFSVEAEEDDYHTKYDQAKATEIMTLLSAINVDALCERAGALRNVVCTAQGLHHAENNNLAMGGNNYHIPIIFADGVSWICRIRRRNVCSTSVEHQNMLIRSEVATYRFLSKYTSIPVPKIHDYSINSLHNRVGIGYILMDKLDGEPLSYRSLTDQTRIHVLNQLADVFVELARHPFSSIGCLMDTDDDLSVIGPLLEGSHIDADDQGNVKLLGPFVSASSYRTASIQHQIDLILREESYTTTPVDAYLLHRFILDEALPLIEPQLDYDSTQHQKFYLKHMDDKGDHIFVDESFNFIGIIDWEWAQTTPYAEAFAAPTYLLDVANYYDNSISNELSKEERLFASVLKDRGETSLASAVENGRMMHRFTHTIGGDSDDPDSVPVHFLGLMRLLHPGDKKFASWYGWRTYALERYKDDVRLQSLLENSTL